MTIHQPGRTRHGGRIAMWYHSQEFTRDERHLLMTDMLYPGLTVENFQLPVAKIGFRTVWDIRETQEKGTAIHGVIDDAIAVDGCLYLKWMPEDLVSATVDFRRESTDPTKIDEVTYNARLKARTPYRVMGEENNYWLKHDGFSDLGNPEKWRARGYAYQTLTAGFAAAVTNMRRIVSFIANAAIKALGETKLRRRRLYDENDRPIRHQ